MTNNQLTLEQAIQHTDEKAATLSGPCAEQHKQLAEWLRELQERRKAERDSEPVGKPFMYGIADPDGNAYIDELCVREDLGLVEDTVNELNYDREEGDELCYSAVPLYRHAQPNQEYPETLPCPVLLEPGMRFGKGVKTRLILDAIQRRAEHYAELEAMTPEERAEHDASIKAFKAMLPQPAPVVPEGLYKLANHIASSKRGLPDEWQDWAEELETDIRRAAMLQAGTFRENGNSSTESFRENSETSTNTLAIRPALFIDGDISSEDREKLIAAMRELSDKSPALAFQVGNSPAIPDGYVMVPKEPTGEMINAWLSEVANWRGHVAGYKAMLAAAQHDTHALNSVQSVAGVPDKWIRVSERMPGKGGIYLVWNGKHIDAVPLFFGSFQRVNPEQITHWRHLPAAPQEVQGE